MRKRIHDKLFSLRQGLSSARRTACEQVGISRYSRPARDDMDRKLQQYLPDRGFFVEAGVFDGFTGSNTYYLERIKGWSGVLVEPSVWNYRACLKTRPGSRVFNCALVPKSYSLGTIGLNYGAEFSFVEGAYHGAAVHDRLSLIQKFQEPQRVEVPARTLTSILEEVGINDIDFLSLDVEGYELSVLQGLDFGAHAPKVMLIECQTEAAKVEVEVYLTDRYRLRAQLSSHDYLFVRRSLP